MSKALSLPPPLHTRYCYEELHAPGQKWGGHDLAGPIFPTEGGRIFSAQVSFDLDFWIFGAFCGKSKKGIIVGGQS